MSKFLYSLPDAGKVKFYKGSLNYWKLSEGNIISKLMDGWKSLKNGNLEIPFPNGGENMDEEKFFFQKMTPKRFIKKILPMFFLWFSFYIILLPVCSYCYWLLNGTGPFIVFPTKMRLIFYCILVTAFITKDVKAQQCLYRRMQEVPFIIFTETNLHIDRAMTQFPWGREWAGTITIEWDDISSIQIEEHVIKISYKDTQKKPQKLNLHSLTNKDYFITLLKKKNDLKNQ